ncbi:MAG: radical SAM protein [candidate division WOR-3 bacterium]
MNKFTLILKIFQCNIHRYLHFFRPFPFVLTLYITNMCNSLCKHCNIGRVYLNNPEIVKNELSIEEYSKIANKIGRNKVFWINISGGEPFMREDFDRIIVTLINKLKPNIITISTNGTLPQKVKKDLIYIFKNCKCKLKVIVNISLDAIGKEHDELRGFKGNFKLAIQTLNVLKQLKREYNNLYFGTNTLITIFNIDKIPQILNFIKRKLKLDNYAFEIVEQRFIFHNYDLKIKPSHEKISEILKYLMKEEKIIRSIKEDNTTKLRKILRFFYYNFLYNGKKSLNPLLSNVYILPRGEVALSQTFNSVVGNLRNYDYDLKKILSNKKTQITYNSLVKDYFTTSVNEFYINFICELQNVLRVLSQQL